MNKKIYKIITIIIIIISILFVSIKVYDYKKEPINSLEQNKIEEQNNEIVIQYLFSEDINITEMKSKYNNKDIIARLEIPNTFNLLLTKTKDNDYYLNHNINKKNDKRGTEYIDYRTELGSNQINIYGHNSLLYNLPFKKLENFLNKEYFEKNNYILLQTEKEKRYYQIAAIKEITKDYEHMKIVQNNMQKHIDSLLKDSINKSNINYNDESNIIILQTCSYDSKHNHKGYYILLGIEIKENNSENNLS